MLVAISGVHSDFFITVATVTPVAKLAFASERIGCASPWKIDGKVRGDIFIVN